MGHGYDAVCKACGYKFPVNEGSGMIAMPFHCELCGKEWWWHFGDKGPIGKEPNPPTCDCGGTFTSEAPPRCAQCGSMDLERDPDGMSLIYD